MEGDGWHQLTVLIQCLDVVNHPAAWWRYACKFTAWQEQISLSSVKSSSRSNGFFCIKKGSAPKVLSGVRLTHRNPCLSRFCHPVLAWMDATGWSIYIKYAKNWVHEGPPLALESRWVWPHTNLFLALMCYCIKFGSSTQTFPTPTVKLQKNNLIPLRDPCPKQTGIFKVIPHRDKHTHIETKKSQQQQSYHGLLYTSMFN